MDRNAIEMLSASLIREYLAKKRLVRTLQQLDEEQSEQSTCVRNRLKLMKALHIGRLMKRNKELESPLDSMVEVIVHFLLGHTRTSKRQTKVPQNDQCEGSENQLVKAICVDDSVFQNICGETLPTDIETNETVAQYGDDHESCGDAKEECQYFTTACNAKEQYNKTEQEQCFASEFSNKQFNICTWISK
nr:probable ubiquitin carboxyl-terminal hydrolase MINDY-4 [Cherax quadricarinatus]